VAHQKDLIRRQEMVRRRVAFSGNLALFMGFMALLSVLLVYGHNAVIKMEAFRTKKIEISGARILGETQIFKQAGIGPGVNALSANLSMARKRLIAHDWIEAATVRRQLPDRITIQIKERRAVAELEMGRRFLIDKTGKIFKERSDSDPASPVIVKGLDYFDVNLGGKNRSRSFSDVMEVLKLFQEPGELFSQGTLKEIHVDRELGLSLRVFDDMKEIKIGHGNYAHKFAAMAKVAAHMRKKGGVMDYSSIDVSVLNRVVVRPSGMGVVRRSKL